MPHPAPVFIGRALTAGDVDAVATHRAPVAIDPAAARAVADSYALAVDLARGDAAIYGLTTGCGPLAEQRIDDASRVAFQRNLVRSHAVALGAPHPTAFVRAAMLTRAQVFAHGGSGVAPTAVESLVGLLNAGIHPIVGEIGGVGASGDLVELAEIARVIIGEGEAEVDGRRLPAVDALRAAGLTPLVPHLREGLALINGTSFHTGVAALLVVGAERAIAAAQVAAALLFEALGGHAETLDPALHAARPHAGQAQVAARLTQLTRGSRLVRGDAVAASQDPYTLRCVPQLIGPVLEGLAPVQAVVEIELNAVSDNPLFITAERRVVHGGNFHGQPVAAALDHLKQALVTLGVASERRIARALDARLNGGLPPFLVRGQPGLHSGFMGLQYCATTLAAEHAVLAAPASVRSIPTNANNQDVVPMGMLAARLAARVLDGVRQLIAIELLCGAQAIELRGVADAGAGTRVAYDLVRSVSPPLGEDRGLRRDVDAVVGLIESGRLGACE
jgi:histidine ammonia-lyase